MTRGIPIAQCLRCGHRVFPDRLVCSACGGDEWRHARLDRGTVEAVTVVHRAPGRQLEPPVRLGTVWLTDGPRLIARLEDDLEPRAEAEVELALGVVVARRPARGEAPHIAHEHQL